jgi:hypothetical protein
LPRSTTPPSRQCTEDIEAIAIGAAPGRPIAANSAAVQSPSAGRRTGSTAKPPSAARVIQSSIADE